MPSTIGVPARLPCSCFASWRAHFSGDFPSKPALSEQSRLPGFPNGQPPQPAPPAGTSTAASHNAQKGSQNGALLFQRHALHMADGNTPHRAISQGGITVFLLHWQPTPRVAGSQPQAMVSEAQIRQATPEDAEVVADILKEAARWLEQTGMPLWREGELEAACIIADVREGVFFLAKYSDDSAGTVKFQLDDPVFWPDASPNEAAYIHRLAVRRRYAGTGLSTALLRWAVRRTQTLGRRYLRLDCIASRPRLRAIYEDFGFRHHSDRQVGPYHVSRYEYDVTRD